MVQVIVLLFLRKNIEYFMKFAFLIVLLFRVKRYKNNKIIDILNSEKAALNSDNAQLSAELSDANLQIIKLNEQEKANKKIILEISNSKTELANQLKMAHEQNEHYQRESAKERSIERSENRATQEQLKTQISEQASLLKSANEREIRKNEEISSLSQKTQKTESTLHELQRTNAIKEVKIESLTGLNDQLATQIKESARTNEELTSNTLSLSNQLSSETSKYNQVNDQISITRKELKAIQERLEQRTEDYIFASQENKSLKSTLKKLQGDL